MQDVRHGLQENASLRSIHTLVLVLQSVCLQGICPYCIDKQFNRSALFSQCVRVG